MVHRSTPWRTDAPFGLHPFILPALSVRVPCAPRPLPAALPLPFHSVPVRVSRKLTAMERLDMADGKMDGEYMGDTITADGYCIYRL